MSGKWFFTLDWYLSEPRLGASRRDCPHMGNVLVVLTMSGAAACVLLELWQPGAPTEMFS